MKKRFVYLMLITVAFRLSAGEEQLNKKEDSDLHKVVVYRSIELMQTHVITRDQVDWEEFRDWAQERLGDTPTLDDRDAVILQLLKITNTNHSFYRDQKHQRIIRHAAFSCQVEVTDNHPLPENIGYIRVDGLGSPSREEALAYANQLQAQIMEQDKKPLIGWVVDLRRNSGGNMWPMLSGVSSLLGDGFHGQFVNPDGTVVKWGLHKGMGVAGKTYQSKIDQQYHLKQPNLPIAVLSSKRTSSSGEAVLVAFKEREDVSFIGQKSCGLATANRGFKLFNGDRLIITVSEMADKKGRVYPDGVDVDITSKNALADATQWILSQQRLD